jgi:prophage regulatory protein
MHDKYLRFNAVREITGLSRSTTWRLERAGKFPARRRLSNNTVGWLASDISRWLATRPTATGDKAA